MSLGEGASQQNVAVTWRRGCAFTCDLLFDLHLIAHAFIGLRALCHHHLHALRSGKTQAAVVSRVQAVHESSGCMRQSGNTGGADL